jgi:hypothetical protein
MRRASTFLVLLASYGYGQAPNRWMLAPCEIPLEEQIIERMRSVRRAEGVNVSDTFLHGGAPVTRPAHTETLYVRKNADKRNRNDVEGKQFYGPADTYVADGGAHRVYRPLFWRIYRYLQLRVRTAYEPLAIEDLHGTFTAFPFENRAGLEVTDPAANQEIQQILATGWRSARLCARETYMDCPFYEQLQYAFVKHILPGVRAVLAFYAAYQKDNGSLRRMPWWNFVDWVEQWADGESPAEADGSSAAALDLQLLLAYQWAADLENALGSAALSAEYRSAADKLKAIVLATDWDAACGLFADQPSHRTYSQQVNTLAVLAHIQNSRQNGSIMQRVLENPTLAQSSIFFRAYTNAALREAGMGDRYLGSLGPWREMLKQGLTTWAEWNGPDARSDCHAWGASPNFELFRTVAGIEPIAPGFRRVRVAPHLGDLKHLTAHMPHPKGKIQMNLAHENPHRLAGNITLPPGVTGILEWAG